MTFSANPFSESIAGARVDGEGLNPLLQNFYMIIHRRACTRASSVARSRSRSESLRSPAVVSTKSGSARLRKWMLFAWVFLSIGNTLGMLWAYEELGWGGYWAWDPVENAAFMPWLTASAFVHSIMTQERRGMLKVWNIVLLSQTFFMTIFGTFLTRSGMIASVHAFAQSNIGIYFTYFMVTIACTVTSLIVYRFPELKNQTNAAAIREYRERVGPAIVKMLVFTVIGAALIRWQSQKLLGVALLAVVVVQAMIGFGLATCTARSKGTPGGRPSAATW